MVGDEAQVPSGRVSDNKGFSIKFIYELSSRIICYIYEFGCMYGIRRCVWRATSTLR
jgi:hypothetical protein